MNTVAAESMVLKGIRRRLLRESIVCIAVMIGVFYGVFELLPFWLVMVLASFRRFYLYKFLARDSKLCDVVLKTTGLKMRIKPMGIVSSDGTRNEYEVIGLINRPSYRGKGLIKASTNELVLGVANGRIYKLKS